MEATKSSDSLTILGHLDELRQRLFYCIGYLFAGTLIGFFVAKQIVLLLKLPAAGIVTSFVLVKPTDAVTIYFKVAIYFGAAVSFPGIFHQAWRFIKPAVPDGVKFSLVPWIFSAVSLFVVGTVFAFKILLPYGITFLYSLSKDLATPLFTLNSYISFALSVLVLGGAVFEMPVIAALLTKLRILTPQLMRRKRREAIFALCVIAAVVTPTTDAFNMIIFVLPMIALYEISIIVSGIVYRSILIDSTEVSYDDNGADRKDM
jgi:sec-independent protein translocase protein TatC